MVGDILSVFDRLDVSEGVMRVGVVRRECDGEWDLVTDKS
jgi:hypothetical protein